MNEQEIQRLQAFIYILMRDYLTSGAIHGILRDYVAYPYDCYDNPFLLQDAQACAAVISTGKSWSADLALKAKPLLTEGPGYYFYFDWEPSGQKIEAIKQCRRLTGKGLKDSKDIVDNSTLLAGPFESPSAVFDFAASREIPSWMVGYKRIK